MTELADATFVVLDLETTGGSARFDRVIEVAALRVERGQVQERLVKLVEPGVPIPGFVTRLTGISAALLQGKPSFDHLLPDLQRLLDGAILVAHNVSFDGAFLAHAFERSGRAWGGERLCTLRLVGLVPAISTLMEACS